MGLLMARGEVASEDILQHFRGDAQETGELFFAGTVATGSGSSEGEEGFPVKAGEPDGG